ncbi:IclR family transcriptional regulator [Diaphorobacter caeni]|uniref:IclR family transcriptional regulator n=1 Tax=Diaphorobacter caeni TaxID=2784387 RepID=UPI00188FA449|nr:IclR family transcriptional regulator [Diaphorobacter caeni]MBF5003291.1 IclR family transcriptional regulator [Diaphorobacter caeni]
MARRAGSTDNETPQTPAKPASSRRGIQSIEVGFRILDTIRQSGRPLPLKELAETCQLTVPNVHYYMVSFQNVGLVMQQPDTGFYGLGPYALRLGLAALEQFDVFTTARPAMAELAASTGQTVFLGVWGNKGPTIVYRVEGTRSRPLLELRVGSVLPLLSSALGRNFLAHLPPANTRELLEQEMASVLRPDGQRKYSEKDVEMMRKDVLDHHISRCKDALLPNFISMSAPIFDMLGEMKAAITLMGPVGSFDDDLNSPTARVLSEKARSISETAGWVAPV